MHRLALALVLVACSDPPAPAAPAIAPEPPAPPAPAAPEPAPPICAEVGSLTAEAVPDAARAANEAALRTLATDAAAAEAALAAVVASAPAYRMARYNHACALGRLGRADEAWQELLPLLCEELPTFGPRLRADEDLAAVRARPDLEAALDAIAELHRAAAAGGVPLVAYTHGPSRGSGAGTEWEEAQAGSYHAATGRFVPMGPRLRERGAPGASGDGGFALNATRWDPQSGRVLSLSAHGTDAEYPSLGPVQVRVHEAATGRELLTHRFTVEGAGVSARLTPGGALSWYWDFDLAVHGLSIDPSGARPSREPEGAPSLGVGPLSWDYVARTRIDAPRPSVALPDGRTVDVGPRPRNEQRYALETSDPDVLLLVTYHHGDCGVTDHFVLERLVISTGARAAVLDANGYPIVEDFGALLFVQVGATLRLFPDLGAGPATTVRAGLGLTSMANDYNPYC